MEKDTKNTESKVVNNNNGKSNEVVELVRDSGYLIVDVTATVSGIKKYTEFNSDNESVDVKTRYQIQTMIFNEETEKEELHTIRINSVWDNENELGKLIGKTYLFVNVNQHHRKIDGVYVETNFSTDKLGKEIQSNEIIYEANFYTPKKYLLSNCVNLKVKKEKRVNGRMKKIEVENGNCLIQLSTIVGLEIVKFDVEIIDTKKEIIESLIRKEVTVSSVTKYKGFDGKMKYRTKVIPSL